MTLNREDVVAALRVDEPAYFTLVDALGVEVAPILAELVAEDDVEIGSKAASLAGYLDEHAAREVLTQAVLHSSAIVRAAAAASLRSSPQLLSELGVSLLQDADYGVRQCSLLSLQAARLPEFKERLRPVVEGDPAPMLRKLARTIMDQLP